MATTRRGDSKAALTQQRAELRRGARGKAHIGDDAGAAAGRAAELAKVRRMREVQHARELEVRVGEPFSAILADLVTDTARLARTVVTIPFRVAEALRDHRRLREAHG